MADPPPIRRPRHGVSAPPIPHVPAAPVAPPAMRTEIPTQSGISEDTGNIAIGGEGTNAFAVPDAGDLVEHMLGLIASEAEALLVGDDADGRLADLNVRIALAKWDGLQRPDEALRHLELAERHPLALRLHLAAALAEAEPGALAAVEARLAALPANERSIPLELDVAEAWLWRCRQPARAAAIADRVLGVRDLPSAWRAHALELATLAHAASGAWPRVVALRSEAHDPGGAPDDIATTAALVLDHTGDAGTALALCWSAIERNGVDATPATLGWLRVLDVALEAAARVGDPRRLELLDRRAELIAALPDSALDALAARHAVAAELARDGQHGEALGAWTTLAEDPVARTPHAAPRVALYGAALAAAAAGDARAALALRRRLVDSDCADIATVHAWRALELAHVLGEPTAELANAVFAGADGPVAERWLDLADHGAPTAGTVARLEARGGLALRWAAACAEMLDNVPRALALWRRVSALDSRLGNEHDHVVRILRRLSRPPEPDVSVDLSEVELELDELAAEYAAWTANEADPRCASALQCARAIVDLVRSDFVEAERSLQRAGELAPKDPFCRAALSAVYRADRRYDQLASVLAELSASLTSRDARAAAAREYAELLDEHLGDPAGARAALERMIADRPDDDDAMLVLAKLHDRDMDWQRSIELRKRAAELAPTPERRAEQWIDIALREERRGERDAALAALAAARQSDPTRADILREQARIHRQAGQYDRTLDTVRAELALDPPIARRMQLQGELAQTLLVLDREPENVVAAYLDVLSIEPDQIAALAGIEGPARQLGMWDELARAFRGAPQSHHNLEVLAEALAHIPDWAELAEVKRRQLELASTAADKAHRASELSHIYERELGDIDGAIRMLQLAQVAAPDDARHEQLMRLLRGAERWGEIAAVLERALPAVSPDDGRRQIELLLQIGELRADKLDRAADATQAYEAVLVREPRNAIAIERLEQLYAPLGRDRELARILELRVEALPEGAARAPLHARIGELRANRGDFDAAIAAFTTSITADPANREVFTAMERVTYKAERWSDAMKLYDIAIAHVEAGASRAYRLGDLYTRRGNVQLQFLGLGDEAIASYQKVIEVDSQPAGVVKLLEEICEQRGDWQPLIIAWERRAETQRDPQRRAEALRQAAQLASDRAGDARESMRINKKLLALDPSDHKAQAALEAYFEDEQDRSGLVEVLKMRLANANGAEQIELLKKIARTSEEGARDVVTATDYYQKILELQPENREALDALGRIYETTEQWAELIDVTRRQIKVTSDRSTKSLLYFKCGSVMEAKFGREQDAIRYYDAAIKASPNCLPAVHGLRDLYRRREEWPLVIETLEVEVKLWSDDKERAGVFAQIGRIHEKHLGDPERAMQFYDTALSVDAECLLANQALFEHYFDRSAWDKAWPLASSLAQKAMREGDPTTRSEFYRKRGVVARAIGNAKVAADSFVVALELKPVNMAALDDLGALAREEPDAWDFDATYKELEKIYKKRDDAGALLARVYVARAAFVEREGDLDAAAPLYGQALELAPSDFAVLSAIVEFHADMRQWGAAVAAIGRFCDSSTSATDRVAALMQQAAIHGDGEMDAARAIEVLQRVLELDSSHQDAYYQLAQQQFLVANYNDARAAIDRVIELATAAGQDLIPEALARYYYYKGRILDAAGDARAAAPQYRRAIEYDPGYAPPALVLARRAADSGDPRQAEVLLLEAAHAAMERGGQRAAVPLQRGLARMLLASGDRAAAIEAYRGILAVDPDGASDRLALAEIYAVDDPPRAVSELRKVLDRDIHHAPAYRLLALCYDHAGDNERMVRVLTALDSLGFAEDDDREVLSRVRGQRQVLPLRRSLDEANRERLLITPAARDPLGELWAVFAEAITLHVAPPTLGENLAPAATLGDARIDAIAAEVGGLFQVDVQVFVGDRVPGLFAVSAFPQHVLVVDRTLLGEPLLMLRYLFGCAYEAIRGGYAALLQLGAWPRREIAQMLRAMISGEEPAGFAADLVAHTTPRQAKVLERHLGARDLDPDAWIDGMLASAKRAGLVACDDFGAAIWMVARLAGERLASHDDAVALGAVLGGPDLVRFYLSDNYQLIRNVVTQPT